MSKYVSHISSSEVRALRSLIGRELSTIFSPDVSVSFSDKPHAAHSLSIWLDGRSNHFLNIKTDWTTTDHGFDFHTLRISSNDVPDGIDYQRKTVWRPASIGPTASLDVNIGVVTRIEIIEACCDDVLLDGDTESVRYDRALLLIGTSGTILLSTIFQSILGTIEVIPMQEPAPEELVERYEVRLTLS